MAKAKKKPVTKPGIYKNMPYEEYDAIPAIRSTYLKKHLHCAANTLVHTEETEATKFGLAAHAYMLEGEDIFNRQYAVMPDFPCPPSRSERGWKNTNEYKALKSEFESQHEGKEIITQNNFDKILSIQLNCLSHPTIRLAFASIEPETVIVWMDKETGILCKIRMDIAPFFLGDELVIADLKTTVDASEQGFAREIINHGYYVSVGMYLEGASIAYKKDILNMVLIACEKENPFRVEPHGFGNEYVTFGNDEFHRLLRKEAECIKSGVRNPWMHGGVIVQERPRYLIPE